MSDEMAFVQHRIWCDDTMMWCDVMWWCNDVVWWYDEMWYVMMWWDEIHCNDGIWWKCKFWWWSMSWEQSALESKSAGNIGQSMWLFPYLLPLVIIRPIPLWSFLIFQTKLNISICLENWWPMYKRTLVLAVFQIILQLIPSGYNIGILSTIG